MKPEAKTELATGWPYILTAFVGVLTGVFALPFYILGPLAVPLEAEFGWSRTSILSASAFLNVGLLIGTPIAGRLLGRYGGRLVGTLSQAGLALILIILALGLRDVVMLQICYLLAGLVCAGSGAVTFTKLLGGRFVHARGLALGLALAGTGVANFLAPLLIQAAVEASGWRLALGAVAGLVILGIPVVAFGYREAVAPPPPPEPDRAALKAGSLGWRDLIVDRRFQLLALIFFLAGCFTAGIVLHMVPMLTESGFSARTAASIASLTGLALIGGRVLIGLALDRLPAVWIGAAMYVLAALGCMAFVIGGPAFAPVMVVSVGLMIGAEFDLLSYLALRYYRIEDYGVVYGYSYAALMLGSMSAPWAMGYLVDIGRYKLMFTATAGGLLLIALLFPLLEAGKMKIRA